MSYDMTGVPTPSLFTDVKYPPEEPYPFDRIWINGRNVSIDKVRHDQGTPRTRFEQSVFTFIRDWLSGAEGFQISTSGSTGKPKSITITRGQMLISAYRTAARLGLRKNMAALVCLHPDHIGGTMMLARSLALGLQINAVDPVANPLAKIPIDKCVQFTAMVPYQIYSILESKHPHLLNGIDHILIGGASLSAGAREKLDRFQCKCYETYGMTETVSHIALRLINTGAKQPYFETLPGVSVSMDARGCLVITADHLPDTVVTNDLVEIVQPGRFRWLGRWDNVVNTGGIKVMPEKIEKELDAIFYRHHFPNRFFIAGLPDDKLGNKVVLILEGVQFSSEILERSLSELESTVSAFECPREVYGAASFEQTSTGKVDRIQTLPKARFLFRVR